MKRRYSECLPVFNDVSGKSTSAHHRQRLLAAAPAALGLGSSSLDSNAAPDEVESRLPLISAISPGRAAEVDDQERKLRW